MHWTGNEFQLKVLRWIADGCPDDGVPTKDSSYKTSAYALQGRGLATVDRRRGKWRAEITAAGRHYLEHGTYPTTAADPKPSLKRRPPQRSSTATSVSPSGDGREVTSTAGRRAIVEGETPDKARFAGAAELPIVTQIRKPHPAIRELVDHPRRVDLPAETRRRVHLISHTLVREALRRGWKVTAVKSEMRQRWPSGRERWWPSNDLYRIDAGAREVGVQFRVKNKRVEHVDTPEEARRRARGQYVWAPRWDYHPTDVLRLFLYHDTHSVASWEDTIRIPVEHRLIAVLDRIEESTRTVIAQREAERKRWEEERRRREEEQRQQKRVADYDTWLEALLTLQRRSREHTELVSFVTELQSSRDHVRENARSQFDAFLAWAQAHLEASNPFNELALPGDSPPEMPYAEWERWKTYFDEQKRHSMLPWHLR